MSPKHDRSEGKRWTISGVQRRDSAGVLMSVFGPEVIGAVEVVPASEAERLRARVLELESALWQMTRR